MSYILHIETASEVCSVAIAREGKVLSYREDLSCLSPVSVVTLMIEECMDEAGLAYMDLGAVAVSRGPGSYTGLRTGTAVAKGICFGLGLPLIAVDTLQSLAWGSLQEVQLQDRANAVFLSMLDARCSEVWIAAYNSKLECLAQAQPLVLDGENFTQFLSQFEPKSRFFASGNFFGKIYFENIRKQSDICNVKNCSSLFLIELARKKQIEQAFENLHSFEPLYMKPPKITTPQQSKFNFFNQ